MKTIKKILCPIDMSPHAQNALRYALKIADQWRASIEVLHTVYPQGEGIDFPVLVASSMQYAISAAQETMTTWINATLVQVQANYEFQHVPNIQEKIELGSPVNSILNYAEKEDIDMVIMGTKGEHNQLEKWLGTVSGEVVQRADCPVLLIPEVADFQTIRKIAYATSLTAKDPYYIWKTSQLLKPFNPVIDCVHIQTQEREHTSIERQDLNLFFNYTMPELQLRVINLQEKDVILGLDNFTETYRSNMLVMFKPRESFMHRLFLASDTRKMALVSKIPMLVIN